MRKISILVILFAFSTFGVMAASINAVKIPKKSFTKDGKLKKKAIVKYLGGSTETKVGGPYCCAKWAHSPGLSTKRQCIQLKKCSGGGIK